MASSLLRRVSRSSVDIFIPRTRTYIISTFICIINSCKLGGHRLMSSDESRKSSPWLMLPPVSEGGDMVYKYYSLAAADKKTLSIRGGGGGGEESSFEFVGSSHGWLALLNKHNNDLFLSNPISRRRIKLPPVKDMTDYDRINFGKSHLRVSKVLLSPASPDHKCRAVMLSGTGNTMSFCSAPFRRSWWSAFGETTFAHDIDDPNPHRHGSYLRVRVNEDLVYCRSREFLICITPIEIDLESWDIEGESEMECWDINFFGRRRFWKFLN